jgi:hypothetical protein
MIAVLGVLTLAVAATNFTTLRAMLAVLAAGGP